MTATSFLAAIAAIVFIVGRRLQPSPVKSPRKLLILPVVLILIGSQGLGKVHGGLDIGFVAAGIAVSAVLGLLRGTTVEIGSVDGEAVSKWRWASVALFAANLLAKVILDVIAGVAGVSLSVISGTLLLTLAVTLAGEAVVVLARVNQQGLAFAPDGRTGRLSR